jgi:hypothetical protein
MIKRCILKDKNTHKKIVRYVFRLEEQVLKNLRKRSFHENKSMNFLLNEILIQYLSKRDV